MQEHALEPPKRSLAPVWLASRRLVQNLRRPTVRLPRLPLRFPRLPLLTILLLVLFGASVLLGVIKKRQSSLGGEVAQAIVQAQHAFDEGVALMELNPVKGRERLSQAKTILAPYLSSLPSRSKEKGAVAELYKQVTDHLTAAMHVVRGDPALFFDATLIKKGGSVSAMNLFEETLGLLATANLSTYTLSLSNKRSQVVGGGKEVTGARHIAMYGDAMYLVSDRGIAMVRLADKKTIPDLIPKSDAWGTIGAVAAYGGNLYLLDTQKSRIWKYIATLRQDSGQAGFSELREYLNPDTLPDLSTATSMAIDGAVWVGTNTGKILRFTQGKENTFLPQGVEPALGNALAVFTSDTVKSVYILDKENKRVVVIDKDGLYLSQYVWESELKPSQIVVSEKLKKILLLAEGKIYSLELR